MEIISIFKGGIYCFLIPKGPVSILHEILFGGLFLLLFFGGPGVELSIFQKLVFSIELHSQPSTHLFFLVLRIEFRSFRTLLQVIYH
jgi:hypothetical protein